jgi:hypothetical protein
MTKYKLDMKLKELNSSMKGCIEKMIVNFNISNKILILSKY